MLKLEVPHIHVHQRRSGKEIVGFFGDNRDAAIATFAQLPCGCDARNSIPDDNNVHIEKRLLQRFGLFLGRFAFGTDSDAKAKIFAFTYVFERYEHSPSGLPRRTFALF